jgi:hypothetical protein
MKEVLAFIDQKTQEFTELPFFDFLQDKNVDPKQRLAFAPCIAPFAMSFGELNKDVFRDVSTDDKVQELINVHTYEDENHWPWLLEDIEKLGLNTLFKFNDALRFLWSDETKNARQAAYYLYHYTAQATPIQRLIVIDATEATGNVLLRMTSKVVRELQALTHTKQDYPYLGSNHLVVDTGHTFCTSEGRRFIESILLSNEERREAFELVEKTFHVFSNLMHELMTYAKTHQVAPCTSTGRGEQATSLHSRHRHAADAAQSMVSVFRRAKPLGLYLVEAGLVTSEQLETALDEQKGTAMPIGQVLSSRGWINQQTIEYMMDRVILPERELALRN